MSFQPAPYPDDVEDDFGPYSRDEIVVARASLLHSMQRETGTLWENIRYKLGILPNGYRLSTFDPAHVWLPQHLPDIWSAPVKLHDPDKADDNDPERGWGSQQEVEERPRRGGVEGKGDDVPWGSGALRTDAERSSPSAGGDKKTWDSRRPPHKRKREDSLHGDDGTPSPQGDNSQAQHTDFVAKKSRGMVSSPMSVNLDSQSHTSTSHSHTTSSDSNAFFSHPSTTQSHTSTSQSCTPEGESRSGQGSSTGVKEGKRDDQCYEVVFQCDTCPYDCQEEAHMQHHLSEKGHYSASRFLAQKDGVEGELRCVYLSVASLITEPEHQFHGQVASCPTCHSVFRDLRSCLDHSLTNHKRYGQYSFRSVESSHTFEMQAHSDRCMECDQVFEGQGRDTGLLSHVGDTGHMALYDGQKKWGPMLVFLCPCCSIIHVNYFDYKRHVFSRHAKQLETQPVVTAACIKLGRCHPARTMLPRDPGIPGENISYDFSKTPLKGDPGFKGVMTKSKMRRKNAKLRRAERETAVSGQQQSRKKKKKDKSTHKQRLAAFKKRMFGISSKRKGEKKRMNDN